MMSDDTEERQLSGLIDILVPFSQTWPDGMPNGQRPVLYVARSEGIVSLRQEVGLREDPTRGESVANK